MMKQLTPGMFVETEDIDTGRIVEGEIVKVAGEIITVMMNGGRIKDINWLETSIRILPIVADFFSYDNRMERKSRRRERRSRRREMRKQRRARRKARRDRKT